MKKVIFLILVMVAILLGITPSITRSRGISQSDRAHQTAVENYLVDLDSTMTKYLKYNLTTMVEDTVTTTSIVAKKAVIKNIYITVTDTVESQGDSVYFKLFIGTAKILDQKTSAFKLPGGYAFTPVTRLTYSNNSLLYYAACNTTSSQTSGITEGAYKINIEYSYP